MLTRTCNLETLSSHAVKLEFTGICIFFYFAVKRRLWVLCFVVPMFKAKISISTFFLSESCRFNSYKIAVYCKKVVILNEPRREKTGFFAYAKTKTQISFAVTAKLISALVFATQIVQSLYFLNMKFQVSSYLL